MSKAGTRAVFAIVGIFAGCYLLSDPKCKRGCKTVAAHLITHGIDELI